MRDIKYRGKRIDNGEWVYGSYYKVKSFFDEEEQSYIRNNHIKDTVVEPNTIGQYTRTKR